MGEVRLQYGSVLNTDYGYTGDPWPGFALDTTPSPPESINLPAGTFTIDFCEVAFIYSPDPGPIDVTVGVRIYDNYGLVLDEEVTELGYSSLAPIEITAALVEFTVGSGAYAYLWASITTPATTVTIADTGGIRFTY